MANIKVSEMTETTTFDDGDYTMVVQANQNKKISKENMFSNINSNIGNLSNLQTTNKNNLVNAINENVNNILKTTLYEGNSTSDSITLSDDVSNYKIIVITMLYSTMYFTTICQTPFNKDEIATVWSGGGYIRGASFKLNGTSLTFNWKRYGNFSTSGTETIAVTKVIGCK